MNRKQKLIDLETESLADALLELAAQSGAADDLVERLIATPSKNIQRFREKLAGLKQSRRFIDWKQSFGFARKLDKLTISITQWMKFDNHEMFKDQIHLSHGRKHSFWSKYEQEKSN